MSFEVSGKIVEDELLGEQSIVKRREERAGVDYLRYKESIDHVRNVQEQLKTPFDPTNPNEIRYPFAWNLHAEVGDLLEFEDADWEEGRLKIFTAVGSILDIKHGVDGFIELDSIDGHRITVTFDITTNPYKKDHKADVIIQIPDEGFDFSMVEGEENKEYTDQEIFDKVIEENSAIIVGLINLRLKSERKVLQDKLLKQNRSFS